VRAVTNFGLQARPLAVGFHKNKSEMSADPFSSYSILISASASLFTNRLKDHFKWSGKSITPFWLSGSSVGSQIGLSLFEYLRGYTLIADKEGNYA